MSDRITNKSRMYDLLAAGAFGNTVPMWFCEEQWFAESPPHHFWGVRCLTPGGPCRLYCPRDEVVQECRAVRDAGHKPQISMMVDAVATVLWMGDIYDSPTGLTLYGVHRPPRGASWRKVVPAEGVTQAGLVARQVLQTLLTPSSYSDLEATIERWPGHVVEMSILGQPLGTIPGRNGVVWEVRPDDGSYEKWN